MKQVFQDLATGASSIITSPAPTLDDNSLLISTTTTLISPGTERMLVNFGKASYLQKARQQPEKVKLVLDKIKTDGLVATIEGVRSKLAQPMPLGYCNVGVVVGVGRNVMGFKVGDRVVSNGPHADIVKVGQNLCSLIPEMVNDETAVFTVLASIGLQGIRLAQPSLGESFVVIGAGLIGLLTIQLLRANGCRVLAIDFDDSKLALAEQMGAEICNPGLGNDPVARGFAFSRGNGVDGVILTASTTASDPINQAAQMSRKRGRIVLVGVTGLELNRADFYEKELSFQVSCSYGPGRYDPVYENKGLDYPIGFVRWTEKRNFEAVLDMMASNQLNISALITHRYQFEEAIHAYEALIENKSALGIVLKYTSDLSNRLVNEVVLGVKVSVDASTPVVGFVGAGNYASRMLIPAFKASKVYLHTIITMGGTNGVIHGSRAGFIKASTDFESILNENEINTVAIVTQHDSHAKLVVKAIAAGKNVFVEKPLAINRQQLADIETAYHLAVASEKQIHLMVGYNRRFAPQVQKMKTLLETINEPKSFIMTMNAGSIPINHWSQDMEIGGGRIIGEACHYIDLMRYLTGARITSVQARCMGKTAHVNVTEDKAAITLGFEDGSFGTIHYLANGSNRFPKERIEVFAAGRVLQLDNFRSLRAFGWPGFNKMSLWKQNKGQRECVAAFIQAIEQGGETPIAAADIFEVARVTIEAAELIRQQ